MISFISQSMLGQFLRCPAQFERVWVYGERVPPGIAARRGSGTHKAAEINHLQKIDSGVDLPIADLQDAARDEYVRLIQEEGIFIPREQLSEKNKIMAEGLDDTTRLAKLYGEKLAPSIQPVLVEQRVRMDVGLGVALEGTIDVLTVDNWLPDLKTSGKSKGKSEADLSLQLSLYAALVAHHTGKWPTKISLEVLVNLKEPILQSLPTSRGPHDFAMLMNRIQMMLAQVEAGLFPPCDPGHWMCSPNWCGFYTTCKYAMKRR